MARPNRRYVYKRQFWIIHYDVLSFFQIIQELPVEIKISDENRKAFNTRA